MSGAGEAQVIEPVQSKPRKWRGRIGAGFGALLVALSALLVLGAFVPQIPWLGALGSVAVSLWPAWLVLLPLTGAWLVWRRWKGAAGKVTFAFGLAAALGSVWVIYAQVSLARANDVELTLGLPFGFAGSLGDIPADDSAIYTHDLGEPLKVLFYRPPMAAPGGNPVLVYVHGGGWVSMSAAQRSRDMRWFADHGWLVVSVDYSLSSETRHLWDRMPLQVGCALAWVNGNIAARGGNPARIALIGESAGGELVLNAAYDANAGKLGSSCGGTLPRINAVSAIYPGVDLVAIYNNSYNPTGADVRSMVTRYIGGSPQQFADRYLSAASAPKISASAPPTLMFISENDHLVPLASMEAFKEQARRGGVPLHTISVPFAEHGFDATGIGNALVRQATLKFINVHDRAAMAGR